MIEKQPELKDSNAIAALLYNEIYSDGVFDIDALRSCIYKKLNEVLTMTIGELAIKGEKDYVLDSDVINLACQLSNLVAHAREMMQELGMIKELDQIERLMQTVMLTIKFLSEFLIQRSHPLLNFDELIDNL
ncbi:MAG: hypothetical protein N4A36_00365 [Candidatus Gracilibacteria bacterium]|jgi:hypothetical protein|nr:hypothetical protein [Candidatus Gracilibacteria bacterium]